MKIDDNPNTLWCDECRELVNQELKGEASRPFRFYFHYYNKQNAKTNQMWELLKTNRAKRK